MKRSTIGALLTVVVVPGMSGATAFAMSHPESRSSNPSVGRVTQASISLLDTLGPKQVSSSAVRIVTDAAAARKLFADILELPAFPQGTMHCPADFGVHYLLDFKVGPKRQMVANVDASGCQGATMDGKTYWAGSGKVAGFWRVLGQTLHLTPAQLRRPTLADLRGAGRGAAQSSDAAGATLSHRKANASNGTGTSGNAVTVYRNPNFLAQGKGAQYTSYFDGTVSVETSAQMAQEENGGHSPWKASPIYVAVYGTQNFAPDANGLTQVSNTSNKFVGMYRGAKVTYSLRSSTGNSAQVTEQGLPYSLSVGLYKPVHHNYWLIDSVQLVH